MNNESTKSAERPITIGSLIEDFNQQNNSYLEALGHARSIDNKLEQPGPNKESDSEKETEPISLIEKLRVAVRLYYSLNKEMHNKLESIGKKLE